MDVAFQDMQADLTIYFGDQARLPALLPILKMVMQP